MLEPGLTFTSHTKANEDNTAMTLGSGDLAVFATPAMIALMENAAMKSVAGSIPEESTTVGTEICVSHTRASKSGSDISATAVLLSVEGRKLAFDVCASDNHGIIGKGTHTRFIVHRDKFLEKLA